MTIQSASRHPLTAASASAPAHGIAPAYPHLLSPLRFGTATMRNRAVMGAMHTRLETLDHAAGRIHAFYRARALGEIGMIITGGVAPNPAGRVEDDAPAMVAGEDAAWHRAIVDSVRDTDALICMQILHAGRYAKFAGCVGASSRRARINPHSPRALTTSEVWSTIEDYARTAEIARDLGYHAVEIMGSEGYLINQFTAPATNERSDDFGGTFENRARFPLEIIKAVRARVGDDFPVLYRISAVDLVEDGMTGEETLQLAALVEAAGIDMLNTGVGWHESSVPTVGHVVPRAAWSYAVRNVREAVGIPVIASNRINDPGVAEALIARGDADAVSMARPLLADPQFMLKSRIGRPERINTCIACNQACLDKIFVGETVSCLVNPRAGHEVEFDDEPVSTPRRIAVVGGGAAGMNFAFNASSRGHEVTLFEAGGQLGGQLLMAKAVPEKTEFDEMLRYFSNRIEEEHVVVRLNTSPTAQELVSRGFDDVVIATGVRPRELKLPGSDHPMVMSYADVLLHRRHAGRRVAIIGAGGIGFDVAEFLLGTSGLPAQMDDFAKEYGLDLSTAAPGGLATTAFNPSPSRSITLLQRKKERLGARLAITTGWIRRNKLLHRGVKMLGGVEYRLIDDRGLHITVDGDQQLIEADSIVVCAGQESQRELYESLRKAAPDLPVHIIGGADKALELDAMRAIDQATRLANIL